MANDRPPPYRVAVQSSAADRPAHTAWQWSGSRCDQNGPQNSLQLPVGPVSASAMPSYPEVEADTRATGQALGVVLLSSVATGIEYVVQGGLAGLVMGTVAALLGWYVWASITYIIGAKLLPMPQTSTSHGALLRTLGFASAPGLLRVFGVVPGLAGMAFLVAAVWMLMATVIAGRQALDYTSRTISICPFFLIGPTHAH